MVILLGGPFETGVPICGVSLHGTGPLILALGIDISTSPNAKGNLRL